jgi:hypothetical protein
MRERHAWTLSHGRQSRKAVPRIGLLAHRDDSIALGQHGRPMPRVLERRGLMSHVRRLVIWLETNWADIRSSREAFDSRARRRKTPIAPQATPVRRVS